MALSDDQKAMLRLLAKREEGYEDIAALKGLSVEEVRAEVKAALAELDSAGEETLPPAPSPVEAPPPLPEPPKEESKAEATPPPPPGERSPRGRSAGPRPRPSVPVERRRFLALAGGALGVVAVVGIAIALIGGSSDSSDSSPSEPTAASAEAAVGEAEGKVTQAVLAPVDGGDASGRAIFGRLGKKEIVLQVTAEGLEPTADGESYTVWLYRTPKLSLRVGSATVGDSGQLGARFPIPAELLAYVASGAFDQINVSRTSDVAYQEEVARARQNKTLPRYSGETVLTGEITGPVVKSE